MYGLDVLWKDLSMIWNQLLQYKGLSGIYLHLHDVTSNNEYDKLKDFTTHTTGRIRPNRISE